MTKGTKLIDLRL